MVDALDRDTVTFGITVRNVEHEVFVPDVAEELVHQRDGRTAVHVVIAVDHDLLIVPHGPLHPFDRPIHVLHQERIVQVRKLGFKKFLRPFYIVYASLYEQIRQHGGYSQLGSQRRRRHGIPLRFHHPSLFYGHTFYLLYILTFNISLKFFTSRSFTSSEAMRHPVSFSIEVTPLSTKPQGLM